MPKAQFRTLFEDGIRRFQGAGRKHAELSSWLRHAITTGVFQVGDRLPTEAEFVGATPYSLGTIQRAIRTLVDEGLVERKPKLGTFVAQGRRKIDEPRHFRFLDDDRKSPLPVYAKVVSRTSIRQRGPWNDYLDGQLLRIDRLVNVNDEFNAYSRFFVDPSRFPIFAEISTDALDGENFRVLLNKQIAGPIERICHRVGMTRPSPQIARATGIPLEQNCTLIEIAAAARGDDFLYYQELTVPPTDRRLELAELGSVHYPG
jgi:GntR family transcriptional regulator